MYFSSQVSRSRPAPTPAFGSCGRWACRSTRPGNRTRGRMSIAVLAPFFYGDRSSGLTPVGHVGDPATLVNLDDGVLDVRGPALCKRRQDSCSDCERRSAEARIKGRVKTARHVCWTLVHAGHVRREPRSRDISVVPSTIRRARLTASDGTTRLRARCGTRKRLRGPGPAGRARLRRESGQSSRWAACWPCSQRPSRPWMCRSKPNEVRQSFSSSSCCSSALSRPGSCLPAHCESESVAAGLMHPQRPQVVSRGGFPTVSLRCRVATSLAMSWMLICHPTESGTDELPPYEHHAWPPPGKLTYKPPGQPAAKPLDPAASEEREPS